MSRADRPGWCARDGSIRSCRATEYLKHQSRRYKGAVRGVMRWAILTFAPGVADRRCVWASCRPDIIITFGRSTGRSGCRRCGGSFPPLRAPETIAATVRMQWAMLHDFTADHDIDLYVVNMPQSTFLLDDYYAQIYDEYRQLLRSLTGDAPFLDLARSLRDDEFYDVTHVNLVAARRTSRHVAQFMREMEAGPGERRGRRLVTRPSTESTVTESEPRHLFRYARPFLHLSATATVLSVVARALVLVLPQLTSRIIDTAQAHAAPALLSTTGILLIATLWGRRFCSLPAPFCSLRGRTRRAGPSARPVHPLAVAVDELLRAAARR